MQNNVYLRALFLINHQYFILKAMRIVQRMGEEDKRSERAHHKLLWLRMLISTKRSLFQTVMTHLVWEEILGFLIYR